MRVIVTGGSGFIGSWVIDELKDRGHIPATFDRRFGDDVRNPLNVMAAVGDADAVIHLAGMLGTHELFDSAHEAVDVNVHGTLNVLEACAANQARYVGIGMPQVWDNVYQATKLCAGKLAAAWHRHHGVPVSHVRAYNVFGPGQHVGAPQKIIPTFASRSWDGEPMPIWGDGSQLVDLVWVGDIARMLVDALEFGDNETFDAGSGLPFEVNEIAQFVGAVTGNPAVQHHPMRLGEHGDGVVSGGEGWDILGWHPEWRPDAFEETVRWYQHNRP